MIVSHRHRFVFVKTRKTAGTSMELHLSRFTGPGDILTPLTPEDETLRRERGLPGPCNWQRQDGQPDFRNHMPAADIRAAIGADAWRDYFTFTIERNPWDKVVSAYFFHKARRGLDIAFDDYVRTWERLPINFPLYMDTAEPPAVLVDRVYRYEELDAVVADLAQRFGWPAEQSLPFRAKSHFRPGERNYRDYYDAETRELVAQKFRPEIDLLGYTF